MTPHTRLVPVLASLTVVVALAAGSASALPAAPDGKARPSSAAARAALADAQALLAGEGASRDASMTLLELWRQQDGLSAADQRVADALLTRPDVPKSMCTASNCYHWTTTGADAVAAADSNGDGVPNYVETVAETVDGVRAAYAAAGYRTPKADGTAGGNAKTDIYLEDTGAESLYGYCTSDQPSVSGPPWDAWAYCVLDNDYTRSQFPTNTPVENLQVTAAHEYFHAIQYAYDAFEDSWFMEATATWAEDELYDDVDDNLQYLENSPLTEPGRPLDSFSNGGEQYGEWIFFRFLTEAIPGAVGGMPVLVRQMWERADGALGGPDDYSLQAVEQVLDDHGVSFATAFGLFASANRLPRLSYEEGAVLGYPSVGPAGTFRLTSSKKDSGWKFAKLAHLSAATARFVPGKGLSSGKLKLAVALPSATSVAVALVVLKSGKVQVKKVPASGKKVPFGSSKVKYVEVTLANAGTRYSCWTGGAYSCQGSSLDDGRKLQFRATAIK